MNAELKAFLEAKSEGDPYELLGESKPVYREERGAHRWWNDVFTVVEIEGRLIGFMNGQVTGDNSLDETGWRFNPDSVCEVEPYEETVTKYRPKGGAD